MNHRKNKVDKEKDKAVQDRLQLLLTRMLRDEDNKYCVDCDSKGPRWASWNLGLFVCIRCAGIHRNLGVHISKVKSVNLDSWSPVQVSSMQQMGNSRARAVYEANLPDGFLRPQNDQSLEQFIRAKYEKKKYIAKEYIPEKPSEYPEGWYELIEAEKQKKDLRKIILPSHTVKDDNSNNQSSKTEKVSEEPKAKAQLDRSNPASGPSASTIKNQSSPVTSSSPATTTASSCVSSSNIGDLLGLDVGLENSASNTDILGLGTSSNSSSAITTNVFGDFTSTSSNNATQNPKDDLGNTFNSISNTSGTEEKTKMSNDSIMALFGKAPLGNSGTAAPMANNSSNMFGVSTTQQQTMFMNQGLGSIGPQSQHLGMNQHASNPFLSGQQTMPNPQLGNLSNFSSQPQLSTFAQSTPQSSLNNQFGGLNLGTTSFTGMMPTVNPINLSGNRSWQNGMNTANGTGSKPNGSQTNLLGMRQ